MKYSKFIAVVIMFLSCSSSKTDFASYKSCQDYNVPLFKSENENKVALLFFPHPDDEIVCGGTIDQLKKSGWEIDLVTLTKGSPEEKAQRFAEWNNAAKTFGIDHSEIYDLPNNKWDNVIQNKIEFWYDNRDSIENMVYRAIKKYNPSIVFTYDTAFGGYGHPEHRLSAVAVCSVFKKHSSDSAFPVKKILQITLTEKMEQKMLTGSEAYVNAQKITGNKTLPDPTVAFNIRNNWPVKKDAGACYTSQLKILKKFYLFPGEDTLTHYNTFDREYFFEIKK